MLEQVLGPIWARWYAVTATVPPSWRRPYTKILGLAVLFMVLGIARATWFGLASDARADAPFSLSYEVLGVVMAIVWSLTLIAFRTRSPRVIGQGTEGYRRVVRATWIALMAVSAVAFRSKDASQPAPASARRGRRAPAADAAPPVGLPGHHRDVAGVGA